MNQKKLWIPVAIAMIFGLWFAFYNRILPEEYIPTDDEIVLHIKLDTKEDVGLLIFDYRFDNHEYSGGISNADKSLIRHGSDNVVVWNRAELESSAGTMDFSIQFRVITEYVPPNYANVYPENITRSIKPISWTAHFGEAYFVTIAGDKIGGYTAEFKQS